MGLVDVADDVELLARESICTGLRWASLMLNIVLISEAKSGQES